MTCLKGGRKASIYQIMWKGENGYWQMDMSAYPQESEVILIDGCKFAVVEVEEKVMSEF